MKLQLDTGNNRFTISAYRAGEIVVNDESLTRSFVIGPEQLVRNWGPATAAELESRHLETILDLVPEIILLGTGARQAFPEPGLFTALLASGVGLEVMDTGAACRTYNILLAEGRRIAAGLMMI